MCIYIYIKLWLICTVAWQKPTQQCKAIILQLKKISDFSWDWIQFRLGPLRCAWFAWCLTALYVKLCAYDNVTLPEKQILLGISPQFQKKKKKNTKTLSLLSNNKNVTGHNEAYVENCSFSVLIPFILLWDSETLIKLRE